MEPDFVEVQVDDAPQDPPPLRLGRYLAVIGAVVVVGGLALAGRAVSEPDPEPTGPAERVLLGATASLAAPWDERWRTVGDVISVGRAVLVSGPDGTGVRSFDPDGTLLWGPVVTGATCAASGGGAVCLTAPVDGTATAVGPDGEVRDTVAAPPGIVDWWVVDGDVVSVAAQEGAVTAQRWVPPGHRGVSWTWQGTVPEARPALERDRTWVRIDDVLLDLSTGRPIATPGDAVALPAWGSVVGPNDGRSDVPLIADGTDVVVAGLRRHPGPAHLVVEGVLVTGSDEVTAYRTSDGTELWQAGAGAAFSDGVAVGLLERAQDGARLTARDLVSGAELWSVDVGEATYAGATTAGVVLRVGAFVVAFGP
jgi:hypothetical protein